MSTKKKNAYDYLHYIIMIMISVCCLVLFLVLFFGPCDSWLGGVIQGHWHTGGVSVTLVTLLIGYHRTGAFMHTHTLARWIIFKISVFLPTIFIFVSIQRRTEYDVCPPHHRICWVHLWSGTHTSRISSLRWYKEDLLDVISLPFQSLNKCLCPHHQTWASKPWNQLAAK